MGEGLVVVVEDEPAIAELERRYLARAGFGVHVETRGLAGLDAVRRLRPVLVVLDVGLPDLDGIELCRRLREDGDWTPVLFVTARDDEVDRVLGLEIGGDDYLTKPFSPREMVARVKAVLRRGREAVRAEALVAGPVRLDPATRQVGVDGVPVALTATEFNLLEVLLRGRGRVLGRSELLAQAWGQVDYGTSRTVDVHVAQLRAKLGDDCPIETVRGVGYRVAR
ncbi:response regulator transcription factor [Nocardioides anomalus]|uniref:Response regulator transcription factor n=1 Tax=Nocardioides anomalus TaxID=2712223 RepID=A0A6G6WFM1_9ACTN|nr:response regulator transcription factor [Nocardioides anomalus]QIG43957.1 response regulator transcription factor [Nocardioides anomalus]